MAAPAEIQPEARRTRERRGPAILQKREARRTLASRVVDMVRRDIDNRAADREWRMQRYAKLRQWSEGKYLPFDNASDVAIPDMMSHSLSVQDALFNATVSTRPAIVARPIASTKDRGEKVDALLDSQFYMENPGEQFISDSIDQFVNEGVCQAYIPWIREVRNVTDVRVYDPIPRGLLPREYFTLKLNENWPTAGDWNHFLIGDKDGWDWRIEHNTDEDEPVRRVAFYTKGNGDVEMVVKTMAVIHDGPRPTNLTYDEVIVPIDSANLQAPSPSNPGGAPHVTLSRRITVDEIKRLVRSGFFDLITEKEADELEHVTETNDQQDVQQQKRTLQGQTEPGNEIDETHGRLTLLVCFDLYDLSNTGENEDVVWWVIREKNLLLKALPMTEMFPFTPPRRPFAEASFIQVPNFREGIGVPELVEGMHDLRKETLDMAVDAGTFDTFKFGFYRPTSNIKPEVIRMLPGEYYPTSDPQRDFVIANTGNGNSAYSFNLMALAEQMEEKITLVGDVQQGRVPAGKSSALRTSGGIAQLMNAGAARPERVLRRYFTFLADIYKMMHQLDKEFLSKAKRVRMLKPGDNGEDLFEKVDRTDLEVEYDFEFVANSGIASRDAFAESLSEMMQLYVNPIAIQMGIVTPENVYQMFRDFGKAKGPNAMKYLTPPGATSNSIRVTAPEAIWQITNDIVPVGIPFEGPEEHFATIQAFLQDEEKMMLLSVPQQEALKAWAQKVSQLVAEQRKQQQMAAAAEQFQKAVGGPGTPGPEAGPPGPGQQRISENELIDESLPGAGGGGNQ